MRLLQITRSPGIQAAIGVLTTALLVFMGMTFIESSPWVGNALLAAGAFRFFAVIRDLLRARMRAREDEDDDSIE